jgi:hypothetical protein
MNRLVRWCAEHPEGATLAIVVLGILSWRWS